MAYTEEELKKELETKEYEYGFYTDIDSDTLQVGLNEDIVRAISKRKEEPEWMTDWRLDAYRSWVEMKEPDWHNVQYTKPDFQAISYYSAPSKKDKYESLDEVDPELLDTFKKLGISIDEQKVLAGVAVDIVVDSVSVATTFRDTLAKKGIIFCSISEAIKAAQEAKLDLVEIAPDADPVVCKILDYGKRIFEAKKEKSAARKKQRRMQVKEMKFRPGTDEGDYQVKLRNLTRFLSDGDKAKVTLRFRGREMAHQELGIDLLKRIEADLAEIGTVEMFPKMEGRQLTMVLAPNTKKKGSSEAVA